MPLPKIATPTYELELPSTGKTIEYRPFLVKEEKLLVIALESEDTKQITTAIKAVLRNCILTKGVKVEALPTFDIEFLLFCLNCSATQWIIFVFQKTVRTLVLLLLVSFFELLQPSRTETCLQEWYHCPKRSSGFSETLDKPEYRKVITEFDVQVYVTIHT